MLAIEREVVAMAQDLASRPWHSVDLKRAADQCHPIRLSAEQIEAVVAACGGNAITIIEGAPGSGKTTTLSQIVSAHMEIATSPPGRRLDRGPLRCIATATAWRIASSLATDLGIESRATASWIAMLKAGHQVFDERTLLIVDEAGLLSSRDMHMLLSAVSKAGAKAVLVGDRRQLQPIGGPGLDLVSRAVEAARVENIVRQREAWARDAITAFGKGHAAGGLAAFADRGLLMEAQGAKAAIAATLDAADEARGHNPTGSLLILAKSNAAVAAISRVARERRKAAELITGDEVTFTAATPSGHATQIALAAGDKIRFLVRNDEAKTATDDRRPVLQEMIDRACGPDHPYDAIVFYAFNRFFRNVAEMELTIRKLRKHGVDVVSVTQPTGDDPSQILVRQILVRQIIGAFDEHTSREISKNTKRAMLESARQGFWNGATPPLGYKIVEAERRGRRSKRSSTPIR
jgi:DNA invertase Pin-like site-specific DNA recombinase/uncharacterized protein with PIN domain